MTSETNRPRRGRASIAAEGAAAAKEKGLATAVAIRNAMRAIELQIEANNGVYPYAGGEVSTAEVLRRAGKSQALLQKPRHRLVREEVGEWSLALRQKIKSGAKVVRRAVTERASSAEAALSAIRQRWVEAELEYVEKVAELEERCRKLETENSLLRQRGNVVPISRRRK